MTEENFNQNDINVQVYQLLDDLDNVGMRSAPRGKNVVEAMMATLDIDPTLPFMIFKNRPFNFKYTAGEIAWYVNKDINTEFISKFSTFWNNIKNPDDKTINSNYGAILLGDHPGSSYDDTWRTPVNQMKWVYDSLKADKSSRQAIAFLNTPYYQFENNKDFVCTFYLNFWIRKGYLDMKVQMRSNDIFLGLSYDAPWFSILHQSMFLNLKKLYPELRLGMYHHSADNIHYYERHFKLVENILSDQPYSSPKVILKVPLFDFNEDGDFSISKEAQSFSELVEKTINEIPDLTQEQWKEILSNILDIQ